MSIKKTVLLVTDFSYQAKGREYFREDIELYGYLKNFFKVYVSHIKDIEKVINHVDLVLIRNTGPQTSHHKELATLKNRTDLIIFNDLSGKGDINGKGHLLELFRSGFSVIPTFDSKIDLEKYGSFENYLLKPLDGADSSGVKIVSYEGLKKENCINFLIQPLVEFQYEVSFYFIGKEFYYSLYAPNIQKRWELKPYEASKVDVEFALKFINWNTCKFGIQRVDACRLKDGTLLLMELEDYNPFLSLDLLQKNVKETFLESLSISIFESMNKI
ncbi:MAG: hypothetical protein H0U27_04015 [Nitrosopumilus sp.]|nr:hypothetical protein [Nitrosopumilus sp.]